MTFPSVASSTCAACNGGSATTTHDITLPSGITAGDLILICWTFPNGITTTFTPPSGWQCLREQRSASSAPTAALLWRFADGSEGSTLSITTSLSVISTYAADRITGASGVAYSKFDTASGTINPPSCTSPWGTHDILWLAYAALQDGYVIGSGPSGYSGFSTTIGTSGVNGSAVGRAYHQLNALSTDPGNFGSVTSTAQVTFTVAVLAADASDPAPQYLGRTVFTQASTSQTDSGAFTGIIMPASASATQGRPHIEAGDCIVAVLEAANELLSSTYYTADGYTEVANYGQGTAAAIGSVSIQVFAKLVADGTETSFTYGDPGNHFSGSCFILRPPAGYEIQIEDEAGSTQTAIGSSVTTVDTFSVAGRAAVLLLMALDRDALSTSNVSSFETGNTGGMTEAIDQTSTTGVGGGLAAAYGIMDAGGALGAIGFTPSASPPTANVATMTLALKCVSTGGGPTTVTVTNATLTNTGVAVIKNAQRLASVTAQTVTLTGQTVSKLVARTAPVTAAVVDHAEQAIVINAQRKPAITAASVANSGQAVVANARRNLIVAAGSEAFSGVAAGVARGIQAGIGSFAHSGLAITINAKRQIAVIAGTISYVGVSTNKHIIVTAAIIQHQPQAIGIAKGVKVTAGVIAYTPQTVDLIEEMPTVVSVTAGTMQYLGQELFAGALRVVNVSPVALVYDGIPITKKQNSNIPATPAASLAYTGQIVFKNAQHPIAVTPQTITHTGRTILLGRAISVVTVTILYEGMPTDEGGPPGGTGPAARNHGGRMGTKMGMGWLPTT